jgi:hypothetical protein
MLCIHQVQVPSEPVQLLNHTQLTFHGRMMHRRPTEGIGCIWVGMVLQQ